MSRGQRSSTAVRFARTALPAVILLGALAACGRQAGADPNHETGADARLSVAPTSTRSAPATTTAAMTTTVQTGCSPSGIAIAVHPVEYALGHRGSLVELVNCGAKNYQVNGYPTVSLLDADQKPMDVTVVHGTSYMASDPGAKPVTMAPGKSAKAVLSWSNTVADVEHEPATGSYVVITAAPGESTQTVPLASDLGTTGELTVTAWSAELAN